MSPYSIDESDILANFYVSDAYKAVCKMLTEIVKHQEAKILAYDLQNGAQKLVEEKARTEGAQRVLRDFIAMKDRFKDK